MCSTSSSVLTSLNCLGIANAPKFQQSWLRDTHRGGQPYQRKAWSVFLATCFWSVMVHGQLTDRTQAAQHRQCRRASKEILYEETRYCANRSALLGGVAPRYIPLESHPAGESAAGDDGRATHQSSRQP